MNHRLRAAINAAGLTYEKLAAELKVSPKTVERWVSRARVPYPRHRTGLVARLDKAELYLWPELADEGPDDGDRDGIGTDEIVRVYPHRSGVPTSLWTRLLDRAGDRIDLLLYTGRLLVEQVPDLADRLAARADGGTRVRLLLGDPFCAAVSLRGQEEGDLLPAKVHDIVHYYRPLADCPNVDVRFHQTTLYASIYQFDDEMLVNTHVYGLSAAHAPVLHLRERSKGPLFETYIMNVDRVWQTATPTWPAIDEAA